MKSCTTNPSYCYAAITVLLVLGLSAACSSSDEMTQLRSEMQALRAAQAQTAAELAQMKAVLMPGAGATAGEVPVRTLTIAGRPTRGTATAGVTFIEYSDYGCPYCAQYASQIHPRLVRDFVDTGKVRYVFKNYPVEQLHPGAFKAHVAAACAGDLGRYWEMHERLFTAQDDFTSERFTDLARQLGIDAGAFGQCLDGTSHDAVIRQDIDEAVRGGVNGTPVFVVALTEPNDGAVTPLRVVVGMQPYDAYAEAINDVLARVGTQNKHE